MRVRIVSPFTVEAAGGPVSYVPDQIVPNGRKNWVDKGLAVKEPADTSPAEKSVD